MIERHIQEGDMFQPGELRGLQTCLDQLTLRFDVAADDNEKAVLAILLLAAFRGNRDVEKAGKTAGRYYNIRSSAEAGVNSPAG